MSSLKIGTVVHYLVKDVTPPKHKFGICINTKSPSFFLINTANRVRYDCIEIDAAKYRFLNGKNRFVSCSRIFKVDAVSDELKIIAEIDQEDIIKILEQVRKSRFLSEVDKEKILCVID